MSELGGSLDRRKIVEQSPPNQAFEAQLERAAIELSRDEEALKASSEDFGRIARGCPIGLIRVRNEAELETVFALANSCGAKLTLRSGGNSQSGQSLAQQSYCVSLANLPKSVQIDPKSSTASCSASTPWRAVVEAALREGLVPRVVPLNLDLSVGGTLSAGGIGASSHRYGSACSNVLSLTAITGAGERVTCSRESRRDVFDAALAGLGRSVVLTSAALLLRPAARQVRSIFALYTSLEACLSDMQFLSTQPACSYIEGFCSSCFLGLRQSPSGREPLFRWFHAIQFALELDADAEPQVQTLLRQLRCFEVVHRETDEHLPYLGRYQARFEGMRRTGAWEQTHPWFEGMLPADRAAPFIQQLISTQPPIFGDGHRLFSIRGSDSPRFLQLPVDASDTSIAVALLPVGIPQSSLGIAAGFVERATALLHQHGGRRYLSGWLGARDEAFWRQHYSSSYADWVATKGTLDPNHVLTSELFQPGVSGQG